MVEPPWLRGAIRLAVAAACAGISAGCAAVPKSRLDECHQLSRTLQAENSRLKDQGLALKAQNQDLNQRAIDDARRLKLQGEEVRRLTSSVEAYQKERDALADAFERIRRQIQVSSRPLSAALLDRIEGLTRHRPGWEFDRASGVLTIASDTLFEPGTDRLTPEARGALQACAATLRGPDMEGIGLLVAGHTDPAPVRRAGLGAEPAARGHLSLDRAARVRSVLADEARLDASRIDVAGFEASRPRDDGPDEAARARNRRIEIHLRPVAGHPAEIGAGLDPVDDAPRP